MKKASLSIIIVTYNGRTYLKRLLDSIYRASIKNYEVIIVDNGSSDKTKEYIVGNPSYSQLTYLYLNKNFGPAFARNEGAKLANGVYLCFLDNDTEVEKNWAESAIKFFQSNPNVGVIQSKLILQHNNKLIDSVGEKISWTGFLVQVASVGELDRGQFSKVVPILAPKSAGMFIRADLFQKIGGFDPDYFIYLEETDLSWRAWLAGYQAVYLPASVVYHHFGTSTVSTGALEANYNSKFHGSQNYLNTLTKNLQIDNLCRILPLHLFLWISLAVYIFFTGRVRHAYWIVKGLIAYFIKLPETLKKRGKIQRSRIIEDSIIIQNCFQKASLLYFIKKATTTKKIGNAKSF